MRTLVTADLHLSANRRDAYRIEALRELYRLARKKGIERTLILGDLTEEKDRHSDWLTNQVVELLRLFAGLGRVYVLQGNHDSFSDPECPFFHFLRHMPNMRWIGRPKSLELRGLGRVLFLPHTRDYARDWAQCAFADHEFVFCHGMFTGVELGYGRKADGGIPLGIIPKNVMCIAGDIHIPQRFANVEYVGAPYTIDFGDTYRPRAIVIDDETRLDDIRLDHLPQKKLLDLDWSELDRNKAAGLNAGDILKIRVAVPRKAASDWPAARDKLRALYETNYVVHSIVAKIIEDQGKRIKLREAEAKSDEQVFAEFVRSRGVDKATAKYGGTLL